MTSFLFSLMLFFLGNYVGLFTASFYPFRHALLLFVVLIILPGMFEKYKSMLAYCMCLFMLLLGLWNGIRIGPSAEQELQAYWGKNVIVSGSVDSLSLKERDGLQSFVLQVHNMESNGAKLAYHKKIRVTVNSNEKLGGKDIVLLGRLQEQIGFRNPGSFDSKSYYRLQEIGGRLARAKVIRTQENNSLSTKIAFLNLGIRQTLDSCLPDQVSQLLGGMLLGGNGLDDESREIFADNGLSHLLSVSGTHLVLLSGLLLTMFKAFSANLQKVLVVCCLCLYALFCGLKAPVLRALFMSCVVIFGGSGVQRGRLLGLAGLFLLLCKPLWILDIGFQLSFGASAGLIYLLPKIKERLEVYLPEFIAEVVSVTLSVQLMSLPIMIASFHQISLISIISNVVLLPVLELSAFLSFLGLVCWYFLNVDSLLKLSGFFIEQVLWQGNLLRNIPFSTFAIASLPSWGYVVYYAWLFLWMDGSLVKNLDNRERNLSLRLLSLIVFALYLWTNFVPRPFATYFLDVGQGDCAVVITPWRKVIVVDTGGLKSFDTGANILVPFLRSVGKKSIDYLVLSHYDNDHVGGLKGLLRNVRVQNIVLPQERVTEVSEGFYELCKQNSARKLMAQEGMDISIDGAKLEILGVGDIKTKGNEASTVARISYAGKSVLFTGDMDMKRENEFSANPRADVLKVAHHGSKSSSSENFLKRVSPSIAVISVARNNMYGHPHKNVLTNLSGAGSRILRTDELGCIKIVFDDEKIKWYTYVNDKDKFF